MLPALLLALTVSAAPKVYDSGSTVTLSEKSVVVSHSDFRYAVTGLVDRSSLETVVGSQDALTSSLQQRASTCSTLVTAKDSMLKLTNDRLVLANKTTAVVRDSAKVATSSSFWKGMQVGTALVIGVEVVAVLVWVFHSAL